LCDTYPYGVNLTQWYCVINDNQLYIPDCLLRIQGGYKLCVSFASPLWFRYTLCNQLWLRWDDMNVIVTQLYEGVLPS
jgi:hypothetical protein